MVQKVVLMPGSSVPPAENSFQKSNKLFLDMIKNPNPVLSDISEEASLSQTETKAASHQAGSVELNSDSFIQDSTSILNSHPTQPSNLSGVTTRVQPVGPEAPDRIFVKAKRPPPKPSKTLEETTIARRNEIMFQHEILRKLYPDANIEPLNRLLPLETMENEYKTTSKKIEMATTIDKSKRVFVVVLLGTEFLLGKLGLNMSGFTLDQLNNMETYNEVLYQLGKKYAVITESNISPELKLVGLLVFSIMVHLVSRTLEASGAETVAGIIQQSSKHTFKHIFG